MGSITNYLEDAYLNHVFGGSAYTPAATLYLALCTADPGEAATGASMNEVPDAGGYARTAISFGAAANRRVTQDADVVFPQATASWGTVSHWAVVDSATYGSGNVLAYGAFSAARAVNANTTPKVLSGGIWVEFSASEISDYLANKLLDLAFNNVAYSSPSTYMGLTTATVASSDTGSTITEPSGGGYARVLVNATGGAAPAWGSVSGGQVQNADQVDFPQASADWGTLVAGVILDAATGGNLLSFDNDMTDQQVLANDQIVFPAGNITITVD